MYAVIKSGGKQYKVSPGERVKLERLAVEEGSAVEFNEVLLVDDGSGVKVGAPLVPEARVRGTVLEHGRGRKLIVFKFKRRKGYHKKQGHRQDYTLVRIDEIVAGSSPAGEKAEPGGEEARAEKPQAPGEAAARESGED